MRILGIDTSGKVAAAALYDSESRCLLAQQTVYTKRTHSQVILPLAERLLADTGLNWQDVDGFAAAKGPGSYTGLRIGIAAVKAMSYALQIPCVGISTLEGLAWQNLSWQGVICAVMTARQSLVYAGLYQSDWHADHGDAAGRNAACGRTGTAAGITGTAGAAGGRCSGTVPGGAGSDNRISHDTSAKRHRHLPGSGAGTVAGPGGTDAGVFAAGESGKGLAGETAGKVIFVYPGKYTLQLSGKYAIIEVSQDKGVRRT